MQPKLGTSNRHLRFRFLPFKETELLPVQQVMHNLLLHIMMQGKEHSDQHDLDGKYFPWLSMGEVVDYIVEQEDQEFKKEDEGKKS